MNFEKLSIENAVSIVNTKYDTDLTSKISYSITSYNDLFVACCRREYVEIVKILLQDDRVDPAYGYNLPIRASVENGRDEVLKILLQDARINPWYCCNLPNIAARGGQKRIVEILLQDSRIIKHAEWLIDTLRVAIEEDHFQIVEMLVNKGVLEKSDQPTIYEEYIKSRDAFDKIRCIDNNMFTEKNDIVTDATRHLMTRASVLGLYIMGNKTDRLKLVEIVLKYVSKTDKTIITNLLNMMAIDDLKYRGALVDTIFALEGYKKQEREEVCEKEDNKSRGDKNIMEMIPLIMRTLKMPAIKQTQKEEMLTILECIVPESVLSEVQQLTTMLMKSNEKETIEECIQKIVIKNL